MTKLNTVLRALRGGILALAACDAPDMPGAGTNADDGAFPQGSGKADAFGRSLVGLASPYPADDRLLDPKVQQRLDEEPGERRQQAWRTALEVLRPVALVGLADVDAEHDALELDALPEGPRWQTWYGVDELRRMLAEHLRKLSPADRAAQKQPSEAELDALMQWNATAVERSDRWPLERYLDHVARLDDCGAVDDAQACALQVDAQLGGAVMGVARVAYSPEAARHILANWGPLVTCLGAEDSLGIDAVPVSDDNFSACFSTEFPVDAALVKLQWDRIGFGRTLPAFDTDATALTLRLAPAGGVDWGEDGDRRADPSAESIYTIELRDGSRYRLTGIHVMTKELRHWQWVTLWWSDGADDDFGEDRPPSFSALPDVWNNYKMCAATSYAEDGVDGGAGLDGYASLQSALRAAVPTKGAPTWCSNPYLEHGGGNAATNCIGCHQHAGAAVTRDYDGDGLLDPFDLSEVIDDPRFPEHGRTAMRALFPGDYIWSSALGDDLRRTFAAEVDLASAGG